MQKLYEMAEATGDDAKCLNCFLNKDSSKENNSPQLVQSSISRVSVPNRPFLNASGYFGCDEIDDISDIRNDEDPFVYDAAIDNITIQDEDSFFLQSSSTRKIVFESSESDDKSVEVQKVNKQKKKKQKASTITSTFEPKAMSAYDAFRQSDYYKQALKGKPFESYATETGQIWKKEKRDPQRLLKWQTIAEEINKKAKPIGAVEHFTQNVVLWQR